MITQQKNKEKRSAQKVPQGIVHSHLMTFKNSLRLQLTPDAQVPFEARKAHQMLLSISKLANKKTGEVKYVLKDLRQVDYEFECEALADFKYCISRAVEDGGLTNASMEELLISEMERIACSSDQQKPEITLEEALKYIQPRSFTKGRNMYS